MSILSIFNIGKERYPALTGVRAVGAAAVFFNHLPFLLGFRFTVDVIVLFFVLSGFLIVYIYYRSAPGSSLSLFNYFVNRFARIYPVYFLIVSIAIWYNHDFRPLLLFKNYTLTHSLFHNIKDVLLQPSWSLTVEECFYLLAPLIMLLIRKFNFLVSFAFGVGMLLLALLISTGPFSFLHTPKFVFDTTFFGYFFAFYCGAWLALLILKKEKEGSVKRKGIVFTLAGSVGTLIALAAMAYIYLFPIDQHFWEWICLNNFILPLPVTVLYFGLITENSLLARVLSGKLFGLLGRTSYAFYLLHQLFIDLIALPYLLKYFGGHYNLFVVASFIAVQLLALGIFVFYEEPLNKLIRKKVGGKK